MRRPLGRQAFEDPQQGQNVVSPLSAGSSGDPFLRGHSADKFDTNAVSLESVAMIKPVGVGRIHHERCSLPRCSGKLSIRKVKGNEIGIGGKVDEGPIRSLLQRDPLNLACVIHHYFTKKPITDTWLSLRHAIAPILVEHLTGLIDYDAARRQESGKRFDCGTPALWTCIRISTIGDDGDIRINHPSFHLLSAILFKRAFSVA
jgi:hypothetical protein